MFKQIQNEVETQHFADMKRNSPIVIDMAKRFSLIHSVPTQKENDLLNLPTPQAAYTPAESVARAIDLVNQLEKQGFGV